MNALYEEQSRLRFGTVTLAPAQTAGAMLLRSFRSPAMTEWARLGRVFRTTVIGTEL